MTRRMVAALLAGASLLSADTLIFRNGNRLEGHFVGGDDRSVRFATGSQVNIYNLNEIESIRFNGGPGGPVLHRAPDAGSPSGYPPPTGSYPNSGYPQTSTNYPPPDSYPPPNGYPPPNNYPQSQPPASYSAPSSAPTNNGPTGIEVPSGTQVVVRLIDGVDSQRDRLGQTFRASVDQPVVVNGQTVIPRGSDAIATLIDAQKSGKIEGRTVLTLDLKSVTVNGRSYDIVTTGVARASSSRGERSAKVIGGTAALGAIIGAVAGGGKGAAIGAGSGAAVGTAAEVATSGQRVKVPSETRLTFTLQNPIDL